MSATTVARPIALENISYYAEPGRAEMPEHEFVSRIVESADGNTLIYTLTGLQDGDQFVDPSRYKVRPLDNRTGEQIGTLLNSGMFAYRDLSYSRNAATVCCSKFVEKLGGALEKLLR